MQNSVGAHAEDTVGGAAKNAFAARGAVSGALGNSSQAAKMKKSQAQTAKTNTSAEAATQGRHNEMIGALTGGQASNNIVKGTDEQSGGGGRTG